MQIPLDEFLASHNRSQRWSCAYVGGTFDLIHRGHLALLANAALIAGSVVVSVNTDDFATRYKRRPLMPLEDRMAVLGALRMVDRVVINTGDEDSTPAILHSGADVIVHGSDWTPQNGLLAQMGLSASWLDEHGISVVTLPYTAWTSTTRLLAAYENRVAQEEMDA